jgi:DNA-binding FadR family transcriptional regulator
VLQQPQAHRPRTAGSTADLDSLLIARFNTQTYKERQPFWGSGQVLEDEAAGAARHGTGRRLHGAIARKLGADILSGDYPAGATLPTEAMATETLGVSRAAYREAVQVLIAKGLVESRPKAGTRVLPRDRWNLLDPDVLAWAFAREPDRHFIESLFELRSIVEPAAAALAAERRSRDDLQQMKAGLAQMRRHTLATEEGREGDRQFHSALLHATGNEALIALSASIAAAVAWTTVYKQRGRELPRDPLPFHVAVYDAIADADPERARGAMHALVTGALEDIELAGDARSQQRLRAQ